LRLLASRVWICPELLLQTKGCARIVNVAAPKKRWTGDRLEGLEKKVDDGFAHVDKQFEKVDQRFETVEGKIESSVKELRGEMNARFEKVESAVKALDSKFDTKFDGLNRTLLGAAVSVIVTLIVCCATLVGVAVL